MDRFANVPAFTQDMPLQAEPAAARAVDAAPQHEDGSPVTPVRTPRYTAGERPASRPVSPSASAKRAQPSRKPRSQRGKK